MEPAASPALFLWLAVVAGALSAVPFGHYVLRSGVNVEAFAPVVRKLMTAGQIDRVVKLTQAMPHAPVCAATRAAVDACREGINQNEPPSGYRDAGDLSPDSVLAPVRARYDAAFDAAFAPVRVTFVGAVFGAMFEVGVLVAAALDRFRNPGPSTAALVALVVIGWLSSSAASMRRSREVLFAMLRECLDASVRNPTQTARPRIETAGL